MTTEPTPSPTLPEYDPANDFLIDVRGDAPDDGRPVTDVEIQTSLVDAAQLVTFLGRHIPECSRIFRWTFPKERPGWYCVETRGDGVLPQENERDITEFVAQWGGVLEAESTTHIEVRVYFPLQVETWRRDRPGHWEVISQAPAPGADGLEPSAPPAKGV